MSEPKKKRRNIRSTGVQRSPVEWRERPWREFYEVRDVAVRGQLKNDRERATQTNALDEVDMDTIEMKFVVRREEAWERAYPTAVAMERLGFPNEEIVWWLMSGHESQTFTLQTKQFCEIVMTVADIIEQRDELEVRLTKANKKLRKLGKKPA